VNARFQAAIWAAAGLDFDGHRDAGRSGNSLLLVLIARAAGFNATGNIRFFAGRQGADPTI